MKLSIITCTYNSEKYLPDTIKSIEEQNLEASIYEHIFIDGESTDETINIIKEYKKRNPDKNIFLESRKAKGIYNAMNEAIKIAKGEYVFFVHSDDYLKPNVMNDYLKYIEETGNQDLYYTKFDAVDANGKFLYNAPKYSIYKKGLKKWIFGIFCYIHQGTILHRRELHDKYGLFNEDNKVVSDKEFFIILAENNSTGVFYDKTTANFRVYNQGTSNNPDIEPKFDKERLYLLNKYYGIEKYIYRFIFKSKQFYKNIKNKRFGRI